MKVVSAGVQVLLPFPDWETARNTFNQTIEQAGRTCYKSEDKISVHSAQKFVRNVIARHHDAMLEHVSLTVRFIVDRGVSHELVRHRMASFAQESTRYCNYSADKFGNELTFIKPCFWDEHSPYYATWKWACEVAEESYLRLLANGATPEQARSVLPNSLKTEVIMTANVREWRHFLNLRAVGTTGKPHPQMAEVAGELLTILKEHLPELFDDIGGTDNELLS